MRDRHKWQKQAGGRWARGKSQWVGWRNLSSTNDECSGELIPGKQAESFVSFSKHRQGAAEILKS